MDIEGWEFLSDDGDFIDSHEDGEKKTIWGRRNSDSKIVSYMNYDYFLCPTTSQNSLKHHQRMTLPIQLDPNEELMEEVTKVPIESTIVRSAPPPPMQLQLPDLNTAGPMEAGQDTVSRVFFKVRENKCVDMKMDSPKSVENNISSPTMKVKVDEHRKEALVDLAEKSSGGLNIWKWSLSGIGAICSFGVAAATICVIFFGTQPRNINEHPHHTQKLGFRIYADHKMKIKEVVQRGTKLNEATSLSEGLRGAPLIRAHITFGGYNHGL